MNKKQQKAYDEYVHRSDVKFSSDFCPEIGDRRAEPAFGGVVTFNGGMEMYMSIEPDGSRHT